MNPHTCRSVAKNRRRGTAPLVLGGVISLVLFSLSWAPATATPPSNTMPKLIAQGYTADPDLIKHVLRHLHDDPSDVPMSVVTFPPGASSGWHSHPGPGIVIVSGGPITLYNVLGCPGIVVPAGQVVVEPAGHIHLAVNESQVQVELANLFVIPHGVAARTDAQPVIGTCDSNEVNVDGSQDLATAGR